MSNYKAKNVKACCIWCRRELNKLAFVELCTCKKALADFKKRKSEYFHRYNTGERREKRLEYMNRGRRKKADAGESVYVPPTLYQCRNMIKNPKTKKLHRCPNMSPNIYNCPSCLGRYDMTFNLDALIEHDRGHRTGRVGAYE